MMAGLPGTGKSTLALEIGKRLGWPVIDKDTFKATLLESGMAEEVAAGLAYELAFALAEDFLLHQRLSVVLDTPLLHPRTMDHAIQLARSANARLKVIMCQCIDELRDQRMQLRQGRVSQPRGIYDVGGSPVARFDYLPKDTLVVDTSGLSDKLAEQALAQLKHSES